MEASRSVNSKFVTQLECLDEFVLREGQKLRALNVHFLPLEDVDELHLLFKRLQQLVPLPLQLLILFTHAVQVASDLVILGGLFNLCLSKLKLKLFNFLERSV